MVLALDTDAIKGETDVVVPDVAVYPFTPENLPATWAEAPRPILVAEIRSPTTWRRDVGPKRDLYVALGVPEYWIVDPDERAVTVVRAGQADQLVTDMLRWHPAGTPLAPRWHPAGATRALEIDLATLLR